MIEILVVVPVGLHPKKGRAENHRQHEEHHQHLSIPGLRVVHRKRHRQRADDQYRGVRPAKPPVQVCAGERERVGILRPIQDVRHEHPTEKQYFGDQKRPHPERAGFPLLLDVVELMGQSVCCRMTLSQTFSFRDSRMEDGRWKMEDRSWSLSSILYSRSSILDPPSSILPQCLVISIT